MQDEATAQFTVLRQAARPEAVAALEDLVRHAPDRALSRINALDLAARQGVAEEDTIAALLHAARLGLFDLAWNVLCPGCGGVLHQGLTLKGLDQSRYSCALCAAGYEPTLDELVEVTFTVNPRVRRIAAHDPDALPMIEYFRQVFWGSGFDLPDDAALARAFDDCTLEAIELPAGERAVLSLQAPAALGTPPSAGRSSCRSAVRTAATAARAAMCTCAPTRISPRCSTTPTATRGRRNGGSTARGRTARDAPERI